jgi:hypothetical protein
MNTRKILLAALAVPVIAASVAACGPDSSYKACSNGQCVTVGPASSSAQVSVQPTQSATTYPTPAPQSESPSASIPGTTAPDPDVTQAVQTCFPQGVPSRDTLVSWTSNQDNLNCLAIPPQEMQYFIRMLLTYILRAPQQTWQNQWTYDNWQQQQVVPLVQRCQQGQSS